MRGRDGHFFTDQALSRWAERLASAGADVVSGSALHLIPLIQSTCGLDYEQARVALGCLREWATQRPSDGTT